MRKKIEDGRKYIGCEKERWKKRRRRERRKHLLFAAALLLLTGKIVQQMLLREKTTVTDSSRYRIKITEPIGEGGQKVSENLLLLVNKEHEFPEEYQVTLHWLQNGNCAVEECMYEALRQMLTDGTADGREFVVASGYRSRETQRELLDEDILAAIQQQGLSWQEAYEQETRETLPPGYSEHETGLAVDIVSLQYQILNRAQEETAENIWLQENCSRYGFILRYPEDAEAITGISYEPWHFRYVGKEAAKTIMSKGITLEEYLG